MKRRFINKINQRIKTLVNRAGVDIETIFNRIESIDGVYVTDTNNINIDTSYFTPELERRLDKLIPTYMSVREAVSKDVTVPTAEDSANFIGPSSREFKQNQAIQAYFRFEDDFERYKEQFYDWESRQNPVRLEMDKERAAIREAMSTIGKAWTAENPDYSELAKAYQALDKLHYGGK